MLNRRLFLELLALAATNPLAVVGRVGRVGREDRADRITARRVKYIAMWELASGLNVLEPVNPRDGEYGSRHWPTFTCRSPWPDRVTNFSITDCSIVERPKIVDMSLTGLHDGEILPGETLNINYHSGPLGPLGFSFDSCAIYKLIPGMSVPPIYNIRRISHGDS